MGALNLLQRINAVRKAVAYIQKDKSVSTGSSGSYKAVTHDTVTAMVREHMVEHGIVSWPHLVDSTSLPKDEGAKQFRYEATYDFTFCNIEDRSDSLTIRIQAHAMDNADKAPGKALSYAKKYALLKLFEIETGEDEESRYNPEGVDDGLLTGYITELTDSADMDTLKSKFAVIYKSTAAANDKDAQKAVTKAYNARKVTLTGAAK